VSNYAIGGSIFKSQDRKGTKLVETHAENKEKF